MHSVIARFSTELCFMGYYLLACILVGLDYWFITNLDLFVT